MTRRPFNYRAYVAGWRAICLSRNLDPRTGHAAQTEAVYRYDDGGRRYLDRVPVLPDPAPECLCDESSPAWWAQLGLWDDPGAAHSPVEAEAIASIASQARRIAGVPDEQAPGVDYAIRPSVRAEIASLAEDGAGRDRQIVMPLREMYAARGEMVDTILGVRMIVPIKAA